MASLDITDMHHPVLCRQEKQEGPGSGHVLQTPVKLQDSNISAGTTDFEEPACLETSEIPDAAMAQNPERQEDELNFDAHEAGDMEGRQVDEVDDGETGCDVDSNRLRWEDGSSHLVFNTNQEREAASRHPFQPGAGNMDSAVRVSATSVNASVTSADADDTEIFTPSSQPVSKGQGAK